MAYSTLDGDLVRRICGLLVCRADRARMYAVCRGWRQSIGEVPALVRSLPLLSFANAMSPSFSCTWCAGECHHFHVAEDALAAHCFSSHDGGWMLLSLDDNDSYLYHVRSGQWIGLPQDLVFEYGGNPLPVALHFVALSASPLAEQCIGAALVTAPLHHGMFRELMFWRVGDIRGWGSLDGTLDIPRDEAIDVLHCRGWFYFLTIHEQVVAVRPNLDTAVEIFRPDVWTLWFANMPDQDHPHERYLVESDGDILMVRRYREKGATVRFRVFMLEVEVADHEPVLHVWTEIFHLDGRMLYVARGCSRCYNTADFPGHVEGVYFKGDLDWIAEGENAITSAERQLLADDAGVWSGAHPNLLRCFKIPEQLPYVMLYSAPA